MSCALAPKTDGTQAKKRGRYDSQQSQCAGTAPSPPKGGKGKRGERDCCAGSSSEPPKLWQPEGGHNCGLGCWVLAATLPGASPQAKRRRGGLAPLLPAEGGGFYPQRGFSAFAGRHCCLGWLLSATGFLRGFSGKGYQTMEGLEFVQQGQSRQEIQGQNSTSPICAIKFRSKIQLPL